MDDAATPISYLALQKGTPVLAAGGEQLGTVDRVLDEPSMDLFDGITVETAAGLRFVDADAVVEITDRYVRTNAASVDDLAEPSGSTILEPSEEAFKKDSLWDRTRRAFGHKESRWEEKDSD